MRVTLLLCDAVQEVGGKLYVLGGGWSLLHAQPNTPANMGLAVLLSVPWDQANQQHELSARLVDEDGQPVLAGDNEVVTGGQLEVGRPAGLKPGTDLNVPLAFNFNGVPLSPGGYRWEVEVDGSQMAIAPFRVLQIPSGEGNA